MAYIDPNHPLFNGWPSARGKGVHDDQASSALAVVRRRLSRGAALHLTALASKPQPGGGDEIRSNPSGDDERDDAEDPVVSNGELVPIGKLVTGQWGVDGATIKRSLMILPNPVARRDTRPFFARMSELANELAALRAESVRRYAAKGKRPGAWTAMLERCHAAVAYVLSQEGVARPSIVAAGGKVLGIPKWGVIADNGNNKLPFVAYSELPMVTCPGAGKCGVPEDPSARAVQKRAGNAWCYSFKAWRYPDAFGRQFLNTLANYADREFSIIAAGSGSIPESDYGARVNAALKGSEAGARLWPQIVKGLVLKSSATRRGAGRRKLKGPAQRVFFRLFVDGDVNTEDCLVEWMRACWDIGPGGRDIKPGQGHVEVYGYSKCWQQFLNVDRFLGGRWPENYTVNMSTGSVYISPGTLPIRDAMEKLPITRGYFDAIPLAEYIPKLEAAVRDAESIDGRERVEKVVREAQGAAWSFDADRIRTFLLLNNVKGPADVESILGESVFKRNARGAIALPKGEAAQLVEVRKAGYRVFLKRLAEDAAFGRLTREEIAKDLGFKPDADKGVTAEQRYLEDIAARQAKRLSKALAKGSGGGAAPSKQEVAFTEKLLHDKALALVLHEVLWAFGKGGSCPLACGSCSDHPTELSTHRCASKDAFRGKHIHIGLH